MTLEDKLVKLRAAFPADHDVSVGPFKDGSPGFACQVDNDFGSSIVTGEGITVEEAVDNALEDLKRYESEQD